MTDRSARIPDYQNPENTVATRIKDLIPRMSVEEKVGQLMQLDAQQDLESRILDTHVGSILHASPENLIEAAKLVRRTRLQIPLIVGEDCIHGYSFWPGATIFPTQLTMAASWNPELLERAARVTAIEASATGVHWTFSPVLCIARDLRWGRVGETFGEDPTLIGELASAMVRGYQGKGLDDPSSILATAKHFAAYSETQGGRDASEADISHRKMRSWFLPPFERVAKEGCSTFMLGYQSTDGVPITLNRWLLNDVLRGEWGYQGMLVTDWDNVGRMVWEQNIQPDYTHAAAAAIKAGNDMIMSTPRFYEGALQALSQGMIAESDLDAPVGRILRLKFELGLFENPRIPDSARISSDIGTAEHTRENLDMARASLVLLRNDGTLPLQSEHKQQPAQTRSIALVGPLADDPNNQLGDWAGGSGQVGWISEEPRETVVTALDGLRATVPSDWQVRYAKGADVLTLETDPDGARFPDGQPRPPIQRACEPDPHLIEEALEASRSSDVTIAVVGDVIELIGEGRSTATLELFGAQNALLEALSTSTREQGKALIIVLMASKPLILPPCCKDASAIIWAGNPGMQGGRALAELLLGKIEPKGRLPISFARHSGQQPTYYNQIRGQHGLRYADLTQEPEYCFGEGLSYSTVEYSEASLHVLDDAGTLDAERSLDNVHIGDTLRAQVLLSNTGTRPATETVQLYIHDVVTSVSWANKELKGFTQLTVPAGEQALATVDLKVSDCTLVNEREERVVEDGDFEVLIGSSSKNADCQSLSFTVR
ncbi:glycoside hydrolase family 3 N-terminal domain-containing protein [Bifidobacterium psychraerophilum]|jgi:beta-glucosidase|uniref:glycoside hydrolase family 3 N-terminal domain-containing protein n=1 Tax=Bifidobacterium psychraerophilum TaxID=218140 RepID=UPI0023F4FBA8|nr:glycoside hydrolase family 3 N-terminal domain-containing protein [Bifidobacterium psychraerophilum]MCI1659949.1 glycoside hydrolase family 3 C-terminal domain-containing protein [Bifidobacterium psychraerophilum]MCI1804978.1 glycoside hydrolase family 3 C-terminal domain-containing protein [Bifidobacterium psychraerophilum]MCI2176040.1 glycoside hydrolase family 3 C-terminal domain-containing protein [Bifidobacterium psychraerophilum]MCI2182859.1 glycoside hydrolase family 3 C-terminal doma